ncbi:MAG: cytochrome P450 [Anaerolineaceae bacterium]|nr:cytochrome P450 [Anaerolineaceae bacterium]
MKEIPVHSIGLNEPDFIANPYPELAELRRELPVFYDPGYDRIFFNLHADISDLLRDKRFGRGMLHRYSREELGWPPPDPRLAPFRRFQDNVFMDMEGTAHTRLRGLVSKVFTPRQVESLREKLEATTNALIDAVPQHEPFNFVSEIAEPLPVAMIADLLGIPEPIRPYLRPWSSAIVRMYEMNYTDEDVENANQAADAFMETVLELAAERRAQPQDDLISLLSTAEVDGSRLTDTELAATSIFLLNAGHEATVNGSSLGLLALLRNEAALTQLKEAMAAGEADALLKTGVNELLRFDTPLPMFERYALEDMEFNGYELKRGQEVALMYVSGNRDEARFPNPNELDLTRKDNPLLTFGLGTHYCVGAPLARLELQTVFRILLERMPGLKLVGEPQFTEGFVIRGLRELLISS